MSGVIRGARILTPEESMETGTVVFDGAGRITAVGSDAEPPPSAEITEGRGLTLAPGFIDLHVHGGGGFSLRMQATENIEVSSGVFLEYYSTTGEGFLTPIVTAGIGLHL